jgi:hypothetical protein
MDNRWNKEVFYSKNFCLSPTGTEMRRGDLNTLYMIDNLAFISEHVNDSMSYFHMGSEARLMVPNLPTELFELYAILKLFGCYVSAVEPHRCRMCVIVPLTGAFLGASPDVPGGLRTAAACAILRDMYVRLLARISINNNGETIITYCFTVHGRAKIHCKEQGFSIHDPGIGAGRESSDEALNLKVSTKHGNFYDGVMVRTI